jgi:hypothetical protein
MRIIDCNVVVGRSIVPGAKVIESPVELLTAMDSAGVDQALIWHIAQHDMFSENGNILADEFVQGYDRLIPCWTGLPSITNEIPLDTLFTRMKAAGVFTLRLFPAHHHYLLNGVTLGALAQKLFEHKVPIILSLERDVTWPDVYQLLKDCPNLTVILTDIGVWSVDRYTWPLLEAYKNVYIETSLLSLEAGGLACGVKKFGAKRFLFGSGYPSKYIEAPLLDLLHADITEGDRELIASGNFLRLQSEAKL